MHEDPLALLPELLMLIGAVATLLAGSFLPRHRQGAARAISAAALLAALTAGAAAGTGRDRTVYADTFTLDGATSAARVIIPAAALLVLALSAGRVRGDKRESEFAVLVLLASAGSMVLAGSSDLLLLAVAYLLASIPLYALAGWGRDPRGAEATLKLYLMGALLGIVMLLGITILFGLGGTTGYARLATALQQAPAAGLAAGVVAVLAGLLFKAGAVPAHFWIPDAAEGATVPAAAFLTTVPKIGALIALYRFLGVIPDERVDWRLLLAVLAAASMTLGNLAAFAQTSPLRLLGWSTVSQVGYLLMAVAVALRPDALRSLTFYLAAYAVTNLGAFAVAAALPTLTTLRSYAQLGRRRPWLAAALVICLLGLVGTPPTAVFIGKLTVFSATWSDGLGWLVVVAAVNTVASLFYYLRWIAPAIGVGAARPTTPGENGARPADQWAARTAIGAATISVLLGIAAAPALEVLPSQLLR